MAIPTTRRARARAAAWCATAALLASLATRPPTARSEDAPPAPPPPPEVPAKAATPSPSPARPGRRDLARRLVALERTIRARPEAFAARRRPTAETVSRATLLFFAGAFGPAADALGEADAALRGERWDATVADLSRLRVETAPVAFLGADGQVRVEVRLVPLGSAPPLEQPVTITLGWAPDESDVAAPTRGGRSGPEKPMRAWLGTPLPVPPPERAKPTPGRRGIDVRIATWFEQVESPTGSAPGPAEAVVVVGTEVAIVGADAPARLAAAKAALAATAKAPAGTPPGVRPTLERLARRIEDAFAGRVGDVVPDVADGLRRLEEGVAGLAAAAQRGTAYVPGRAALAGDSHRTTGDGKAYRLYVPPRSADGVARPLPLVVALHGAGGNEDMYFEAYGAGEALALAAARGWILAAPDVATDAVAVAEDVRTLLDVDPKRIHLTGHSMGAVAAWAAAAARPELWAGVAPVAGGALLIPRGSEGRPPPPVLAVTGDLDFGRATTEAAARRARDAGLAVELRVLPDLDHLLVVAASLPGIFAWFDAHPRP